MKVKTRKTASSRFDRWAQSNYLDVEMMLSLPGAELAARVAALDGLRDA